MGGKTPEPVTTAEAKERLRRIARETGLVPWVRRQPVDAVLVAILGGFIVGGLPRLWSALWSSRLMGRRVGRKVVEHIVS